MERDMDCDLIKFKVQNADYATNLYRALCNVEWNRVSDKTILWSCSWRYAGGMIASLRHCGEDYMDFYCSGGEGTVDPEIQDDMLKLGWEPESK